MIIKYLQKLLKLEKRIVRMREQWRLLPLDGSIGRVSDQRAVSIGDVERR